MPPPGQAAAPPWYHLIERFRFFAFAADGGHQRLLDDALRVRQRLYREQFRNTPLAGADDHDAQAVHVLAYVQDEPVCSCRIVSQNVPLGLELARYADLSELYAPDRVYAEISRLAVASEFRRITSQSFLLLGLLKTVFAVAHSQRFTDYVIWVRPGLLSLYRSFGFVDVPSLSFPHAKLGNVVHQVMKLDLDQFRTHRSGRVSRFFFDPLPANVTLLLNARNQRGALETTPKQADGNVS